MMIFVKDTIKKIVYKFIPPPSQTIEAGIISYSQSGEDAIINFLLACRGMDKISYLDIGTNIPDNDNNTYMFYRNGSRGVCVEADQTLIPMIKAKRPEDKIINIGVSTEGNIDADFYIFDCAGMSTFDKEEAEQRSASGKFHITDVVKVSLDNINHIIENNFDSYPDFLSIDIEGLDLDVLKTLNFEKYPIPIICVETCTYSENHIRPKDNSITQFMESNGYEVYADSYINTIFVNKEWFYK